MELELDLFKPVRYIMGGRDRTDEYGPSMGVVWWEVGGASREWYRCGGRSKDFQDISLVSCTCNGSINDEKESYRIAHRRKSYQRADVWKRPCVEIFSMLPSCHNSRQER